MSENQTSESRVSEVIVEVVTSTTETTTKTTTTTKTLTYKTIKVGDKNVKYVINTKYPDLCQAIKRDGEQCTNKGKHHIKIGGDVHVDVCGVHEKQFNGTPTCSFKKMNGELCKNKTKEDGLCSLHFKKTQLKKQIQEELQDETEGETLTM